MIFPLHFVQLQCCKENFSGEMNTHKKNKNKIPGITRSPFIAKKEKKSMSRQNIRETSK